MFNNNTLYYGADWNSVLFIILDGTKEEHLDMLDGGIIQKLLEEKWKTFARVCINYFCMKFPILLLLLFVYRNNL